MSTMRPLYVDLDGTLVRTDTLHELILKLARRAPWTLLRLPRWLRQGRANLKRQLVNRVRLDAPLLPYNEEVVAFLREEKARGRRVVLATAADEHVARDVSDHLGVFDDVIASNGDQNFKGKQKLAAIRNASGDSDFDYIGDSLADCPIWEAAHTRYAVDPSRAAARWLEDGRTPERVFPRTATRSRARSVLSALRPTQWSKNALLFVPLGTSHQITDAMQVMSVFIAFVAFCLVASAGYVLNDLFDLEADRNHPKKKRRPFASGDLPVATGVVLFGLLVTVGAVVAALFLPPTCAGLLAVYFVLTISYSHYFKQKLLIDVIILAGLHTLRVLAGGEAAGIWVSEWLLAFAMFMFLSLAIAKRYSELQLMKTQDKAAARGRGYRVDELDLVMTMGTTSGFISILVFSLYIKSDEVKLLYPREWALWFACPVLFYWIMRIWFLARRGELPGDPVAFAVRDGHSILAGLALALVIVASKL